MHVSYFLVLLVSSAGLSVALPVENGEQINTPAAGKEDTGAAGDFDKRFYYHDYPRRSDIPREAEYDVDKRFYYHDYPRRSDIPREAESDVDKRFYYHDYPRRDEVSQGHV